MRLSIVELAPIAPGSDATQALQQALEVARYADARGFHRIWFAEHHVGLSVASHHPELLIAVAASQTTGIRVGSGAVLMNHYSPFKVAEMFKQLEAMTPGRIDLGMGRATTGPVIDAALQRERRLFPEDDHGQQLLETLSWLYNAFPEDHPFATQRIVQSVASVPQTWVLGSSPGGSRLAAALGIGYAFAAFITQGGAAQALRTYREQFAPRNFGIDRPRAILAVNVTVGETAAEAERLVASPKALYGRLSTHGTAARLPTADEAMRELTEAQRAEPVTIVDGRWPRFVAGDPEQVRATLDRMVEESGADELMIQDMIADPRDRRRSHELLAQMYGLEPRQAPQASGGVASR